MNLLGIDTATPATAVALCLRDGEAFEARDDPATGARPGHTSQLLPLAAGLLARAGIGWKQLDAIAVGLGPGTFTGLRVGVASARALAQSLGIEAIGVGSLAALALPALRERLSAEAPQRVLAVLDARRGEAFVAAYGADGFAPVELLEPCPVRPERLAATIGELVERTHGPVGDWLAVGDGALLFADFLADAGVRIAASYSPLNQISAAAVCELALGGAAIRGEAGVLPLYGRRPDAELALGGAAK